ncbi:geraniol 8-hydroxylase-like [Hibiscus syriacus]|uniref:Geraniol 8-hydroxylase-like n=1 Tax=Hibiscus syriacus TaxID=106335 RepID=A0A6A2ZN45_HIBSY|nr:cytochrome P450 76T24-like [Hibiscus syriacus]XP_039012652.1 cytochrome P450 76T24-like [Hibiscus syriacus]KAE8693193.1 geraniol 8-hydroxylase-like [Hibiscus syriacus]
MELYTIILFCISFFLLFLRRSSAAHRLPPGPFNFPILGSLHRLGSHPNQSLFELAKTYGPLMTLRLGYVTTVVVSSAEIAKQVLLTHDETFSDHTVPDAVASQPNHESTLAWAVGDGRWRNRRRICNTQLFTVQRLNSLQHLRHQKVQQLIEHINKQRVSGSQVNIGQLTFATALNLISSTIFSTDIVDPDFSTAQEFKELVWRIMEYSAKPNSSDYFPMLKRFDWQGIRKHIRQSYLRLHVIFDVMIEERMEVRASDSMTRNGDFLDVLLDQCEENESYFTRQNINPLILDLFIAGSDTSALTTEWAMAELLRKPEVLKETKREVMEVIGTERAVHESDIDKLPYLQAVVKETMRLHPVAPLLLPYKVKKDVEICGYNIPKNAQLLVNAWGIGRDPKYWTDPLSFRPERFLDSSLDFRGRDFEYIPFGAGRRICSGMPLAVRMVHLMLASMVHSFDWKLPPGINPQDLDMQEQFGTTLRKAVPLCVVPI